MINLSDYFDFHKKDIIVVGCSTGPDSMALLDMLLKIRSRFDLDLIVAHVNHNVRKESYDEALFLKQYCEQNHLFFESMIIDSYGDDNFHNEARNIRYHFFDTVVHKYHAHYLMTAHHGDDLMETILMRMVRGSNLNGYCGFKTCVDMGDYKIIRPLVSFTKKELEEYDVVNHVPYYIDKSNLKDTYTRNRYRKYVLPFLKTEDKNVHLKFLKYSMSLIDACSFIDHFTEEALHRSVMNDKIMIDHFLTEDPFIQKEILYHLLSKFYQDDLILINDRHIELILKILCSKRGNAFVNLPNNVLAIKSYNFFYFQRDVDDINCYEIEFDKLAMLPNHHSIEKIESCSDNSNNICRLNSKEIALPLIIRTRRIGERMYLKGTDGSKKLKDIFIDKKISMAERDSWPVVVDSMGNIVWLPGLKKSKFDKKISEEYDIILRYN